jgi:hypothetical protein
MLVIAVVAGGLFIAKKAGDLAANPGLAAVKLMVAANPEIELVSADDANGVVTIREKKTGKTISVNFDQIRNGRIDFEGDGQKVSMQADTKGNAVVLSAPGGAVRLGEGAKLPDWLPVYPGATAQSIGTQSSEAQESGMVVLTTSDPPKKVIEFYQGALNRAGITGATSGTGIVSGQTPDRKRSVQVTVTTTEGKTTAGVTYASKK